MTTSRKTPQDRKPKAEVTPIVRAQDTPGFSLLKSIDEVPVWDQAPLLSLVHQLMPEDAKPGEEISFDENLAISLMGEIARAMLPWAVDEKEFTKFCSGKGAIQRVMELAMAWTSVLGEDESSDAS